MTFLANLYISRAYGPTGFYITVIYSHVCIFTAGAFVNVMVLRCIRMNQRALYLHLGFFRYHSTIHCHIFRGMVPSPTITFTSWGDQLGP